MKGGIHMQEITLESIFNTLLQFKEETNNRFNQIDKRFEEVDKHFNQIDKRFEEIDKHFDEIDKHTNKEKLFLKGRRTNRTVFDKIFTNGQSVFNTCLFGKKIYDVGAIPVLFSKSLLKEIKIDDMPNDFSIELYIYERAVSLDYQIIRFKVRLLIREKGNSSWNHGLKSKIKQSKKIFDDSIKIKRGEKVL